MRNKYKLAFDTSTAKATVALVDCQGNVIADREKNEDYGQAKTLLPFIQSLLSEAHITFKEISHVLTIRGPGSFTGIRLGLATALGFKIAAKNHSNLNVSAFSAFDVLSTSVILECDDVYDTYPLCLVLDTKREDFFVQCFSSVENGVNGKKKRIPLDTPKCLKTEEVEKLLENKRHVIAGHGVDLWLQTKISSFQNYLRVDVDYPSACRIVNFFEYYVETESLSSSLNPLYIRPAYVYEKK